MSSRFVRPLVLLAAGLSLSLAAHALAQAQPAAEPPAEPAAQAAQSPAPAAAQPAPAAAPAAGTVAEGEWRQLFNGRDLSDWLVKLNHHELGDNYADTFRVEDGIIKVRYDKYDGNFGERFGHLYFKEPFSHYHLAVEYRFDGELYPGAPGFAAMNSGVMLHCLDPHSMLKDQNWPISIELQFYASLGDGQPRATGNACTPGTHVFRNGELTTAHVIRATGKTFPPDEWVRAEAIVRGNGSFTHLINGEVVLEYSQPQIGGGVVSGYDPAVFIEGKPLSSGFIALQSEGQPVDFRKVEIKVPPAE